MIYHFPWSEYDFDLNQKLNSLLREFPLYVDKTMTLS